MAKQFDWQKDGAYGAGHRATMPGEITLYVTPDRTQAFGSKPARGTTWRAGASQWDEATRTISRYGRDEYGIQYKTAKDAMAAAERIYLEVTNG